MKNIFAFLLLFLFTSAIRASGYEIIFCTKLDSIGRCKGKADEFTWNGDKMQLLSVVKNKSKLKTTKLNYKVFLMKNDHDGELAAELTAHTKTYWSSAVKKIYFFKPGYYKIDVYDATNKLIVTGFVTITEREIKKE